MRNRIFSISSVGQSGGGGVGGETDAIALAALAAHALLSSDAAHNPGQELPAASGIAANQVLRMNNAGTLVQAQADVEANYEGPLWIATAASANGVVTALPVMSIGALAMPDGNYYLSTTTPGLAFASATTPTTGPWVPVGYVRNNIHYPPQTNFATTGVVQLPPNNTRVPEITGLPFDGSTLNVDSGDWDVVVTVQYQWLVDGVEVGGATNSTFTVPAGASFVQARVTATGPNGLTSSATSDTLTITAPGSAPAMNTPPSITGGIYPGETLTADPGVWSDATSFSYEWRVQNVLRPETGLTMTVPAPIGALGYIAIVTVTALNGAASTVAQAVSQVLGTINLTPPLLTGNPSPGQLLQVTAGDWTSANAFNFRWLINGADVQNGNLPSFVLPNNAAGDVVVEVTADDVRGTAQTAVSNTLTIVILAPVNNARPSISGTPTVGSTLSVATGDWSDLNASFAFQWYLDGNPIAGQTGPSYVTDTMGNVTIEVTASNAGGSNSAFSDPVFVN